MTSLTRNDSSLTALTAYSVDDSDDEANTTQEVDKISGSEDEETKEIKVEPPKAEKRERSESPAHVQPVEIVHRERKAMRLVSYGDMDEDEEEEEENRLEEESSQDETKEDGAVVDYEVSHSSEPGGGLAASFARDVQKKFDEVPLPPEPPGKCSKRLQEKIASFYEKVQRGHDLNASIQRRKDFRNPSIFEKLIQFCAIDEKGTNYPPKLYDPSLWGPESYYDELAKAQKIEMDKREKERKERTKVEFVTGTVKKSASDASVEKRKSKWDTQPSGVIGLKPSIITSTSINPPSISSSTSTSGTKTTVIPAVGSISKKSSK